MEDTTNPTESKQITTIHEVEGEIDEVNCCKKGHVDKDVQIDLSLKIENGHEHKNNLYLHLGDAASRPSVASQTENDGNIIAAGITILKTLDANRYATKKTIAQGMLDIALLTANASQLKYILQVGHKHEFYTLMLSLIIVSIILQVVMGLMCLSLNLLRDIRLHIEDYHSSAIAINYCSTGISLLITILNLLISVLDPSVAKYVEFVAPEIDVL